MLTSHLSRQHMYGPSLARDLDSSLPVSAETPTDQRNNALQRRTGQKRTPERVETQHNITGTTNVKDTRTGMAEEVTACPTFVKFEH